MDAQVVSKVAGKTGESIKMAATANSKPSKVQTTLNYKQTKLNLNQYSIKRICETKQDREDTKPPRNSEKDTCEQAECVKSKNEHVTEVPATVPIPQIRRVVAEDLTKIVIDLETTSRASQKLEITGGQLSPTAIDDPGDIFSLADAAEICQIAATDGSDEFNVYIIPKGRITSGASAVNKLRKKKGGLYQGNERLSAVYQNDGLRKLLTWLKLKTPCLLIAHNARSFDAKHLLNAFFSCREMGEFSQKVLGFSDSLTAFRERFPERTSYSQTNLAEDLLSESYNAHNALDDVRMLHKLVSKFITEELLLKHSFTVSWYRQHLAHARMTQENMKSLEPLLRAGKISEGMAGKIAGSGLRMSHLEFAYQNGGGERLCCVLTELNEGKPRVTNHKKILAEICSFFEEKTKDLSLDTQ